VSANVTDNLGGSMDFFDLFKDSVIYPENIAERGVPQNMILEYVSHTFLNGLINYITPFWSCVLERYRIWKDIDVSQWENCLQEPHLNLRDFDDDIFVLGETENSFWFFWFDCDVSDCMIGRIEKSLVTKEKMKRLLIEWIKAHEYVERRPLTESIVGNYYELPVEAFKHGWVSF
jgi:hypothetical protein